jgi:putative transposase
VKFGQQYANQLRRKRAYIADKWHLDEVVVTIKGQQYYLWRAVDTEGNVLDILMRRYRDTKAAKRFFRKLLKKQGFTPRVLVTDKLKSYEAAKKQMLKSVEHRQHKGLNNRAENSHQPTRVRERRMRRFKSPGQASAISICIWTDSRSLSPQGASTYRTTLSPTTPSTISRLARNCWTEFCSVI